MGCAFPKTIHIELLERFGVHSAQPTFKKKKQRKTHKRERSEIRFRRARFSIDFNYKLNIFKHNFIEIPPLFYVWKQERRAGGRGGKEDPGRARVSLTFGLDWTQMGAGARGLTLVALYFNCLAFFSSSSSSLLPRPIPHRSPVSSAGRSARF